MTRRDWFKALLGTASLSIVGTPPLAASDTYQAAVLAGFMAEMAKLTDVTRTVQGGMLNAMHGSVMAQARAFDDAFFAIVRGKL